MSFLKRVLSREPNKRDNSLSTSRSAVSIKAGNTLNITLQSAKINKRNSLRKIQTESSTNQLQINTKPPLSNRKVSFQLVKPEIPKFHISLKSLSTPVSIVSTPRSNKTTPKFLAKPNDFIEPEVESDIPTLKEYMENTTKTRANVSFADTATDSASKRSSREISRSFFEDNMSQTEKLPEKVGILKVKEKISPMKLKGILGAQLDKQMKIEKKLSSVIRDRACQNPILYGKKG
ncbi:unnamed protein product [Blepharisma stoltei]|uniref:Uncharacterized protein n=1 Tax=Blepharisma stoltei TaxID=1481888 RepID=A0AAU9I8M5_9CILI|nr:unnamed protein product [Blepharisma stoltei]